MKGKTVLYLDQWGQRFYAKTVKELQEQVGGKVSKMYIDGKDGKTYHTGYVVGQHWMTAFVPMRKEA